MIPGSDRAAHGAASIPRFALRVAVIHGNRLCGELLRELAARAWGCEVVAASCAAGDGIRSVANTQPDVLILGHAMPGLNAVGCLPELRRACPAAKILVLASELTEYLVHRLSQLRPHAVIEECSDGLESLSAAIVKLRGGGSWFSAHHLRTGAALRSVAGTFAMQLSDRELDILAGLAHAMDDGELAGVLGLTPKTVRKHRTNIARKLNLRSAPHCLMRYALAKGFDSLGTPVAQKR